MTQPIYVCSKGRPEGSTFHLLQDSGLKYSCLVEPQEIDLYAQKHPAPVSIGEDNRGIAFTRNAALAHARKHGLKWFWMLDDDISKTFLVHDGKVVKTPLFTVLATAERELFEIPLLAQGALEYQQFAWSAKKPLAINSYCDVAVLINVERTMHLRYRGELALKEDRDFTLQCLASGSLTARSTWTAFACPRNGSNKGGLYDVYAENGRERRNAEHMAKIWPGVCEVVVKPSGRVDSKINWRKFKLK